MNCNAAAVFICAGILLLTNGASSAPITFSYTGHITQIAALDPADPFPDPISDDPSAPTLFSGSYTFDPLAPNGVPADPSTGAYQSTGVPYGITLLLGGLSFNYGTVNIGVLNDYPFPVNDQYLVSYAENPSANNPTGTQVSFSLTDFSGTGFNSNALPLLPPSLAVFSYTQFFFTNTIFDNQVELAGVIDSLTVSTVPEPATWLMTLLGLMLLPTRFRSRGRRAIAV